MDTEVRQTVFNQCRWEWVEAGGGRTDVWGVVAKPEIEGGAGKGVDKTVLMLHCTLFLARLLRIVSLLTGFDRIC